jgi:hypothetical protein
MAQPKVIKELSPLQIEARLQQLPVDLWKLNCLVVKAHEDLLISEQKYENARDNAYLTAKAANPDMTAPELKAHSGQVAVGERSDMIVAQAKYERAKNDAEACDKMLGAFQSIVKLRSSEMRSGVLQDNYSTGVNN